MGQFNGVALHPTSSSFAMGGTQDNGNQRFTGSLTWTDRTGSDGGFNLIGRNDPSRILAANYYAYMNYSSDAGDSFRDVTSSRLMSRTTGRPLDPMAFYPPAVASPSAPATVLFGTNRVWRSTSLGQTGESWEPLSVAAVTASGRFTALDTVGDGSGPVWAGTNTGEVYFSVDGGASFASRTAGLSGFSHALVSRIKIVSADGKTAYVALAGFSGLPSRHVFRTTDGGLTFTNVSSNLPDVPVVSFAVDPSDPTDLFAGTDVGVFRSVDGGASWTTFNEGLPNVTIADLAFHETTGDLVAATYGRGLFRISAAGATVTVPPSAYFAMAPEVPTPNESVAFTDFSGGSPLTWQWDFGDGRHSTDPNPRHSYSQGGTYYVSLTVTNLSGSSARTLPITVAPGSSSPVSLQVPIVLDVFGVRSSHFTSDLVAVNRGGVPTRLSILYSPAPGTPGAGGPILGETLGAGRELRIPDVIEYLRRNGHTIPASGPLIAGTLRLTFEDVEDPALVYAGSRLSTPNPTTSVGGSFGLFASAGTVNEASTTSATVIGLRADSATRSNLAVEDVPGGSGPAILSILLFNGDTGLVVGDAVSHSLRPGEWKQFNAVLPSGVRNGYAIVTRAGGGSNRFAVYGVMNDGASSGGGGTSDGSYLGSDASPGLVPVVLRASSGTLVFTSDLVLYNPGASEVGAVLTYVPSQQLGPGQPGSAIVAVGPGRQIVIPDVIPYLRDTLRMPLAAGDVNQGGTLTVTGASAYSRISNANPDTSVGGRFGLSFPAVPASRRARTEAWVYGLRQDSGTRSNLAIADARVGDSRTVRYVVDLYDPTAGISAPRATATVDLAGGQWYQLGRVLDLAGIVTGYARVRPQADASDFVVYGILNDGENPGDRTSDGSYVPMSGIK
jgi:PKD repeat protein